MVVQKKFSVSEILRKGIEAHKLGNFDVAFAFYKVLVDKFPGHPDASHNLGILAIDMGKPEAAAPLIHDAINSKPKHKQYWLSLLSVYRRLNLEIEYKYTVARIRLLFHDEDEFLQIISKDTETFIGTLVNEVDGSKWKKLGARLFQEGAYGQLIPLLVDAVYVAPDDANAWFTLGLCYRAQGNVINAILNFKHSLDVDPSLMVAYRQLGALLSGISFSKPVAGLTEHLYSLLNGESLVQPKSIARAALAY